MRAVREDLRRVADDELHVAEVGDASERREDLRVRARRVVPAGGVDRRDIGLEPRLRVVADDELVRQHRLVADLGAGVRRRRVREAGAPDAQHLRQHREVVLGAVHAGGAARSCRVRG